LSLNILNNILEKIMKI